MGSSDNWKDYFGELAAEDLTKREIQVNGVYKTIFLRRISTGERKQLNAGIKFKRTTDGGAEVEMDQGDSLRRQHMMVQFSVVREDGKKVFRTVEQVAEAPEPLFLALHKEADLLNKEDSNEGKDSRTTATSDTTTSSRASSD